MTISQSFKLTHLQAHHIKGITRERPNSTKIRSQRDARKQRSKRALRSLALPASSKVGEVFYFNLFANIEDARVGVATGQLSTKEPI